MVQHVGNPESTKSSKNKAIPLHPPPQFCNGNAYGGNQSFVQSSNDIIMGPPLISENASVAGSSSSAERIPGVVGLTNIGNTCFMNSGLQCLLNTPSLSEFFLKSKPFNRTSQKLSLLNHFQYVVKQTWYGPNSKINLHDFKNCLAATHNQFNDSRQHDCQEFLALLLDSLHEQLKKWAAECVKSEDTEILDKDNTENYFSKPVKSLKSRTPDREPSVLTTEEATSTEKQNVPSTSNGNDESVSNKNGINLLNLPDKMFSQGRKHSGRPMRSNETVSLRKRAAKFTAYIRNPIHSGLKSQNIVKDRLAGNFEAKYRFRNRTPILKGAKISLFQLPNFTPPEHVSSVKNHDRDISSTSSNSPAIKENKWMDLKNHGTYGFNFSRNRKKKYEDRSPGSRKKIKIDVPDKSMESDAKRKLDFATDKSDGREKLKSPIQFETNSSYSDDDKKCSVDEYLMGEADDAQPSTTDASSLHAQETEASKKLGPKRLTIEEEAKKARKFWKQHIDANNTVVAKTFQGLLKSTVICSSCDYNSVTYEPFMYLSLPFPRVLERKLAIWFISMKNRQPIKLEVTVGIMDDVKKVKHEVGKVIPGNKLHESEAEMLILTEVYNFNVQNRNIDNSTLVRKLNDNHNIYAFQLNDNFDERYNSCVSVETNDYTFSNSAVISESMNAVSSTTRMNACTYLDEDWDQDSKLTESKEASPLTAEVIDNITSTPGGEAVGAMDDGVCRWSDQMCGMEPRGSSEADDSGLGSGTSDSAESGIIGGTCEATDSDIVESTCDDLVFTGPKDTDYCSLVAAKRKGGSLPDVCSSLTNSGGPVESLVESSTATVLDVGSSSEAEVACQAGIIDRTGDLGVSQTLLTSKVPGLQDSSSGNIAVSSTVDVNSNNVSSWTEEVQSETSVNPTGTIHCIICLEDCLLTDMRQHVGCDCVICLNCVKSSIQHHIEPNGLPNQLKCATCMKTVDGSEFVQYKCSLDQIVKKFTMQLVPILFRNDPGPGTNNNSSPVPRVFGYPWLVKIPSTLPATELYEYISSIRPFPQVPAKILTVTYDGKSCGQCGYASSCYGCEFPRTGNVTFGSRTFIAVSYTDLSMHLLNSIEPNDMAIEEHSFGSPSWVTPNEPHYDIHDCLRAFSEIEHLDEQNPWFCPHCEKNQCATKALSVCHFPDYLIVYLKRFVFLDHSSNKLNNKLKFPVSDLDLSEYIASEFSGKEWKYDLYGCICHFGSVSSGHYTAFGKNPNSGDWHYFNDDVVSPQCPKDLEHSSAYVLFYARKGVEYDIPTQAKVRSLPGLNTLSTSRPVNVVTPSISNADDPWEPEDDVIEVTSSGECSDSPQPVLCGAFSGGTVDTMDEMSLSVGSAGTPRPIILQWSSDKVDEDYWDDVKGPVAIGDGDDCKTISAKHRSTINSSLHLEHSEEYDPAVLINGQEFPGPLQIMTTPVNNDVLYPNNYDGSVDIQCETDASNMLD